MLARICFGWAVVLSNPIDLYGHKVIKLRLTENSFAPGQEILAYPMKLIKEYEEN